jgi:hypothetical protein
MKMIQRHSDRQACWPSALRHSVVWLLAMSVAAGCATSAINEGDRAAAHGQWDAAIAAYEPVVRRHPDDRALALKLQTFKQEAAFVHMKHGEQLLAQKHRQEALAEFQQALVLYPTLDTAKARVKELQQPLSATAPVPAAPKASEGTVLLPATLGPQGSGQSPSSPAPSTPRQPEESASLSVTTVVPGGGTTQPSAGPNGSGNQEPAAQPETPPDSSLTLVTIQPQELTAQVGGQVTVQVNVSNVTDLFGAPFYLRYDPTRLEVVSAAEGGFLNNDGQTTVFLKSIDAVNGEVIVGVSRLGAVGGVSGSGNLMSITFKAKASGPVTLSLQNVDFRDAHLSQIPVQLQPGHIQIEG